MFEYFLSPKNVKQNMIDSNQLAELLVKKDFELKQAMECLKEQETLQSKIDLLKKINKEYDDELQKLQQNFKEAVVIMATAIFQAKQKLSLIKQSDSHPISVDELIKYAHKISADHSVASPYNWEIGDQRRPYPTDLEMKSGLLVNSNDANLSSLLQQQQNQFAQNQQIQNQEQAMRPSSAASASNSPYSWGNQFDGKQNMNSQINSGYDYADVKSRDNDEVEVMSTDSSSSSSSDSQ
ncbi:hypothetical protein SSS_02329 [Sarcoptes scabiei]|nr:hypothetical protein SSS_02329 [Sarcoptes scabiei]